MTQPPLTHAPQQQPNVTNKTLLEKVSDEDFVQVVTSIQQMTPTGPVLDEFAIDETDKEDLLYLAHRQVQTRHAEAIRQEDQRWELLSGKRLWVCVGLCVLSAFLFRGQLAKGYWKTEAFMTMLMGKIDEKTPLPVLVELSGASVASVHTRALKQLVKKHKQKKRILPVLGQLLQHNNPNVRQHTAYIIGESQSRLALPLLRKQLRQEKNHQVRRYMFAALQHLDGFDVKTLISQLLQKKPSDLSLEASSELIINKGKAAIEQVSQLLEHKDKEIRLKALVVLSRIGSAAAVPHLLKALKDSHPAVRYKAIQGLAGTYTKRSIDALASLLKQPKFAEVAFLTLVQCLETSPALQKHFGKHLMKDFASYPDKLKAMMLRHATKSSDSSWPLIHLSLQEGTRYRKRALALLEKQIDDLVLQGYGDDVLLGLKELIQKTSGKQKKQVNDLIQSFKAKQKEYHLQFGDPLQAGNPTQASPKKR